MDRIAKLSKKLSWALRHAPGDAGITLDDAGWTALAALCAALQVSRDDVLAVVRTSDKQRFAVESGPSGERIRAQQGHSVDVELGYEARTPPDVLFHGTVASALASITKSGLVKGKRHHVHMSADEDTATTVGARRGRPVIVRIDARRMHGDGHAFFQSGNGVWLTDAVPARYLTVPESTPTSDGPTTRPGPASSKPRP